MVEGIELPEVELKISAQGCVRVNHAVLISSSERLAAIVVDLGSKHAQFAGASGGDGEAAGIFLDFNERTTNLLEGEGVDPMITTDVQFPAYVEWDVFACTVVSYAVYVCLIKKDKP